jgi:CubicO group peptidase (beta-lactamase class C family)
MLREQIAHSISARAEDAIRTNVFPGCVIGIVRADGERLVLPFGRYTYEEESPAVEDNSVYDMASVTKSIPTASLLMLLVERGVVSLDDLVTRYIPEFGNHHGKDNVSLRHLLSYTLDLEVPTMSSLKDRTPEEIVSAIVSAPLRRPPGSSYLYTNSTACIIGLVLRNASGKNIDTFAEEEFFSPLEMRSSTFHPEVFEKKRIIPTEFDLWRGILVHGEVHDESTAVLNRKFILGISGLFSSAPDILNFLEMLLYGGTRGGIRYFSESTIRMMETNQISHLDDFASFGWELNQKWFMGRNAGPHTFGKTGFTGTCVVCDVERGIAYTILSNRIFPKRPENSSAINAFRAAIGEIILSL